MFMRQKTTFLSNNVIFQGEVLMNNLMYRGSSHAVKPSKINRKSEKTYRGAVYTKLPKSAKVAGLHTYRGVQFSS
jgi:hypothetical protein